jgi:acetyl-CoA C-acetyltransferase
MACLERIRRINDVAIIGVGLHRFGRFEGKSAMELGVDAT